MLDGTYTFHHALIGGVLIGLASFLATFSTGKTPGISGVCARLLVPATPDKPWCFIFLVGLIVGAGSAFHFLALAAIYRPQSTAIITAVAGLLVSVGTRVGGGCTSGHGVCGIGWALAGFCPGPALANLAALRTEALIFVPLMLVGMSIAHYGFGTNR